MQNRSIFLRLALWTALSLTVASCATTNDVKDAVGASQRALLGSYALQEGEQILLQTEVSAPNAVTESEGDEGREWREKVAESRDAAVKRIDVFLDANKDLPGLERTVNALRLRKALLLVVGGEPNLAQATFDEIDSGAIGNARDLALYKAHDSLIWWWTVAGKGSLTRAVFEPKAIRHTERLDEVIDDSPDGSAIRYYLATLRAHVYLKWSSMLVLEHEKLLEGLSSYAGEFDASAQENVRKWSSGDPEQLITIPTDKLRWFGQAKVTYDEYERRYERFFQETRGADPQDLDSKLRELVEADGLKPTLDQWSECNCSWLASL